MTTAVLVSLLLAATAGAHAGAGAAALPAAHARPDSPRVDLDAERATLLAADRALSQVAETRGFEALAGHLAADAYFLPVGADVLHGADAIRAYLAASPAYGRAHWEPFRADVSADGTTGYTLGTGTLTRKNGETAEFRVITWWRKEGGAWKAAAQLPSLGREAARPVPAGFGTPAGNAAHPRPGAERATREVMQADRDFAALAQERDPRTAFVRYVAPTGVLIGGPAYGPEDVGQGFQGGGTLEWGPVAGGAAESGDLGFTVGVAVARFQQPDGTPGVGYSKYLTVWQRQADGRWLWVADGGTPRPTPRE